MATEVAAAATRSRASGSTTSPENASVATDAAAVVRGPVSVASGAC